MKIAHISDIHFFKASFSPLDLLSNKCIGNLNALIRRRKFFITTYLDQFLGSLIKEEIEVLIVTGDFTTTASSEEFLLANEFVNKVISAGIKVFALPGNHDTYTKKSFKNRSFYTYLDILPKFSSKDIHVESIHPSWDLILLDNTMRNKAWRANGRFSGDHGMALKEILNTRKNVIIANHFPLEDRKENHRLLGGHNLKNILKQHDYPTLYLHGHTHKTAYHKEDDNLHIFNSSEVTVTKKFKYHKIHLDGESFSHKEIQYFE